MRRLILLGFVATLAAPAWSQDKPDKKDEKKEEKKNPSDEISDDEAKTRIADFQKDLKKAKGLDDQVQAVEKLGEKKHSKILDELKKCLGGGLPDVRSAAALAISKYKKDERAADALVNTAKGSQAAKPLQEVAIKCIRYLADVGIRSKSKEMHFYFDHPVVDISHEAIDTCKALKSKDSIDPLINLLLQLEAIKEESSSSTGGAGGSMPGAKRSS